jgi:hypothetical protein
MVAATRVLNVPRAKGNSERVKRSRVMIKIAIVRIFRGSQRQAWQIEQRQT